MISSKILDASRGLSGLSTDPVIGFVPDLRGLGMTKVISRNIFLGLAGIKQW
jgi:hypothetical protein